MKKLMIVAAVATMAGALVAADGYDFTASVKTTKGKYGSQKTTYKVNCGTDDAGIYWWDGAGYLNDNEAKKAVKAMDNDEKMMFAIGTLGYDPARTDNEGKNDYGWREYYKGKTRWCYTFSFSYKADDCYRVAGSRKLKGVVAIDDCCGGTWEFITPYGAWASNDFGLDEKTELTRDLFYRFGGVSLEKATKVEYAGQIGSFGSAVSDYPDQNFALAGQGAWDSKNGILKNISGNIVGILMNPDCESCCDYNQAATVFDCDGTYNDAPEGTAAFGTWSMKYNKKYTF